MGSQLHLEQNIPSVRSSWFVDVAIPWGTVANMGILSGVRSERKEKNTPSSLSLAPGKSAKVGFGSIKEKY